MNDSTLTRKAPSRPAQAPVHRLPPAGARPVSAPPTLDLIACDGCGRSFTTSDGAGMLDAIKGPCPECGGAFQLAQIPAAVRDRLG